MTIHWQPGDRITAQRLNEMSGLAALQGRSVSVGRGAATVLDAMANQSSHMQKAGCRLCVPIEDFKVQENPTDIEPEDEVPSAECIMVRLDRATGAYVREGDDLIPFRVWDPMVELAGRMMLKSNDPFYAVWNLDSVRWEVLAPGFRLYSAIVLKCIGSGWHEVELCDWFGRPTFWSDSAGCTVNESCWVAGDDDCFNDVETRNFSECKMPCQVEPCNTAYNGVVPMDRCLQNEGRRGYAHTSRQLPMKTGGFVKLVRRVGCPVDVIFRSDSESGSYSCSADDTLYFDVVDGEWPIHQIDTSTYALCREGNECRVIQTSSSRLLVEGYACEPIDGETCLSVSDVSGSNPS
jgi:hypothetical protein